MKLFGSIVSILALILLYACSDGDSFSDSPSKMLSFSVDTVKLDTVFSRVPTPTKSFWVYNKSGSGIRCSKVVLAHGNQTGYRVNVDGQYLSSSSGFQVSNVEIRNKDSIRVFVELTAPENGMNEPSEHKDELVFLLESGVEQRVNLQAFAWDAQLLRDVVISRDSVMDSDKPTIVYGGIRVNEGCTLTIPEGNTIYFNHDSGIDVYGRLIIEGSPEREVVLRGARIDRMFDYLPYDMLSGLWSGLTLHESSYDNVFRYADIHSTFNGVVCDSSDVNRDKLQIQNSTIHNCQGAGLKAECCKINIINSLISNTLGNCLDVVGGDVLLQHVTLAQFYPFDSQRGAALSFANDKDVPLKIKCYNSLITGYANDQLMGMENDTTAVFDYEFASSIIRTPQVYLPKEQTGGKTDVADTIHFRNVVFENVEDTLTMGEKHFVLVDINKQRYDFRLSEKSAAKDAASPLYALPIDRLGRPRDEKPDIGCFER